MTIKTLELKRIEHAASLSQETHAFSANIYVNGKKVGSVSNEGHGGCDMVRLDKGAVTLEQLNGYCKANEPAKSERDKELEQKYNLSVEYDFEIWCCDQVNRYLAKKELKKMLKSKILHIKNGNVYEYRCNPTKVNIDAIKKRDNIEITLNEMDFEIALDNYIKHT